MRQASVAQRMTVLLDHIEAEQRGMELLLRAQQGGLEMGSS